MNIFSAKQKPLAGVPVEVQRIYNLLSPKPKVCYQQRYHKNCIN